MEIAKKVKVVIINAKRFAVSAEIRKFAAVTVRTCRLSGCSSPAPESLETPLRSAFRRRVKRNAWSANVPATSSSNNHKMKLKHLLFTLISFLTFAGFHTAEAQKNQLAMLLIIHTACKADAPVTVRFITATASLALTAPCRLAPC